KGVQALIADIRERINALDAEEATGLIQKHGRDEALKILSEREAAKESQSQAQKPVDPQPREGRTSPHKQAMKAGIKVGRAACRQEADKPPAARQLELTAK
ncbi:MAG: hypothetical protein KDK65_02825, partial [Chlamydiia bacterium]|nr:hypothetical protein [Chlamydiia bacterium]